MKKKFDKTGQEVSVFMREKGLIPVMPNNLSAISHPPLTFNFIKFLFPFLYSLSKIIKLTDR